MRTSSLRLALPVLLLVGTLATFVPALDGEFLNWDDNTLFTGNQAYRGLGQTQLRWMFTTTLAGHYMPITWLTLGVNYVVSGMDPWGYHLCAMLLHALNGVLFYLVARRLLVIVGNRSSGESGAGSIGGPVEPTGARIGAFVAALVFAVHPQRAESVAWITERGTLVSAGFYLTAVLAYLHSIETGAAPSVRRRWRAASLIAFAAALLGKGIAMTLPATLLILDIYPLRRWRGGWRRVLLEKTPYFALGLIGAGLALYARTQGARWSDLSGYGLEARLAFAGYSVWFYPASTIWPIGLSPLYEIPARASLLQWRFLAPALAAVAITVALVLLRRRSPGILAAWAHSAIVVAPVSGIAHSGSQLVSDRYSYLAGLGLALVAGYGVAHGVRAWRQGRLGSAVAAVGTVGLSLVLFGLAVGTWGQTRIWHDSETLWRWAVEQDPDCATCNGALAEAVLYGGGGGWARLDESEAYVRRAIALRPTLPTSYSILGTILLARGRLSEARTNLETYMRLAPTEAHGPARLALVYLLQDRPAEAIPLLLRARELKTPPAGRTADRDLDEPRAEVHRDFTTALRLLGDHREELEFLGQALVQQGRNDQAVEVLRRAVAVAPDSPVARFWLMGAYEAAGRRDLALEQLAILRRLQAGAGDRARLR